VPLLKMYGHSDCRTFSKIQIGVHGELCYRVLVHGSLVLRDSLGDLKSACIVLVRVQEFKYL